MIYKSLFHSMNISAQGLSVQRTRMNVVSENLANVDTTKTADGGPYRRKIVHIENGKYEEGDLKLPQFKEVLQKNRLEMEGTADNHYPAQPFKKLTDESAYGVHVANISEDPAALKMIYDPNHPEANEEGYVAKPNINPVQEMIDLITASRSYEANVTALNSAKDMIRNALKI
ncbi:MAG: flagellar basal body rod protein FlgC [Candidatus Cloacimonetes bacterium]|nr:flagellar basal body rod protein FlgC [Candidatus Cloacimonadota bacterium]